MTTVRTIRGRSECGDFGVVETPIYDADGACIGVEKNNGSKTWFEPFRTPLLGQELTCRYTREVLLFTSQYEIDTNYFGWQKKEAEYIEKRYLEIEEHIERSEHYAGAEKIWQMLNNDDSEIREIALTMIKFKHETTQRTSIR